MQIVYICMTAMTYLFGNLIVAWLYEKKTFVFGQCVHASFIVGINSTASESLDDTPGWG